MSGEDGARDADDAGRVLQAQQSQGTDSLKAEKELVAAIRDAERKLRALTQAHMQKIRASTPVASSDSSASQTPAMPATPAPTPAVPSTPKATEVPSGSVNPWFAGKLAIVSESKASGVPAAGKGGASLVAIAAARVAKDEGDKKRNAKKPPTKGAAASSKDSKAEDVESLRCILDVRGAGGLRAPDMGRDCASSWTVSAT